MYFSKESRYRNLSGPSRVLRRSSIPPGYFLLAGIALLLICCACAGVVIGLKLTPKSISNPLASFNPVSSAPKATATPNLKAEVPLKGKGLTENGLEVTVNTFQRPLQVQGLAKLPADQQFVLVSLSVRNSKTTGQPLALSPDNFKLKGDGGLEYAANPKTVTIENLLTAQDTVAPGKSVDRELIFQIAQDDTGLKMYWTIGKTIRVFLLEPK